MLRIFQSSLSSLFSATYGGLSALVGSAVEDELNGDQASAASQYLYDDIQSGSQNSGSHLDAEGSDEFISESLQGLMSGQFLKPERGRIHRRSIDSDKNRLGGIYNGDPGEGQLSLELSIDADGSSVLLVNREGNDDCHASLVLSSQYTKPAFGFAREGKYLWLAEYDFAKDIFRYALYDFHKALNKNSFKDVEVVFRHLRFREVELYLDNGKLQNLSDSGYKVVDSGRAVGGICGDSGHMFLFNMVMLKASHGVSVTFPVIFEMSGIDDVYNNKGLNRVEVTGYLALDSESTYTSGKLDSAMVDKWFGGDWNYNVGNVTEFDARFRCSSLNHQLLYSVMHQDGSGQSILRSYVRDRIGPDESISGVLRWSREGREVIAHDFASLDHPGISLLGSSNLGEISVVVCDGEGLQLMHSRFKVEDGENSGVFDCRSEKVSFRGLDCARIFTSSGTDAVAMSSGCGRGRVFESFMQHNRFAFGGRCGLSFIDAGDDVTRVIAATTSTNMPRTAGTTKMATSTNVPRTAGTTKIITSISMPRSDRTTGAVTKAHSSSEATTSMPNSSFVTMIHPSVTNSSGYASDDKKTAYIIAGSIASGCLLFAVSTLLLCYCKRYCCFKCHSASTDDDTGVFFEMTGGDESEGDPSNILHNCCCCVRQKKPLRSESIVMQNPAYNSDEESTEYEWGMGEDTVVVPDLSW